MIQCKSSNPVLLFSISFAIMAASLVGGIYLSYVVPQWTAVGCTLVGLLIAVIPVLHIQEPPNSYYRGADSKEEPINWDLISRNIEEVASYPCTFGDRQRAIQEVYNATALEAKRTNDPMYRAQAARLSEQLAQIEALDRNRQQNQANQIARQVVAELAEVLVKQRQAADDARANARAERALVAEAGENSPTTLAGEIAAPSELVAVEG